MYDTKNIQTAEKRLGTLSKHLVQYEIQKLKAEYMALCDEYYRLNDELRNVEVLRPGAENIMREDGLNRAAPRSKGLEI